MACCNSSRGVTDVSCVTLKLNIFLSFHHLASNFAVAATPQQYPHVWTQYESTKIRRVALRCLCWSRSETAGAWTRPWKGNSSIVPFTSFLTYLFFRHSLRLLLLSSPLILFRRRTFTFLQPHRRLLPSLSLPRILHNTSHLMMTRSSAKTLPSMTSHPLRPVFLCPRALA